MVKYRICYISVYTTRYTVLGYINYKRLNVLYSIFVRLAKRDTVAATRLDDFCVLVYLCTTSITTIWRMSSPWFCMNWLNMNTIITCRVSTIAYEKKLFWHEFQPCAKYEMYSYFLFKLYVL